MKKKLITAALVGSAFIALVAKSAKDPVLMTIDGQDVRLSEFEYLYNKNNTQQVEPITLERYVDLFVDYKLKVADALHAGIDTTASYLEEFNKSRKDLATPYMRDEQAMEDLIKETYSHFGTEVMVSHIMLAPNFPGDTMPAQRLDSIRNLILAGEITFEDAARKYSVDKGSAPRGGNMGWVTPNGRYPWTFENAAFDTAVGELSPVVNSGFGFHIVRPDLRRPSRGEVRAQHILVLTRGKSPEEAANAKVKIDSIYNVVTTPGTDFGEVARRLSEDPGSARKGGDLGWFGSGRMVAEFDSAAFALREGEISKPFATSYGYHIVLNTGHRGEGTPTLDEARDEIVKAIENDSRAQIPVQKKIEKLAQACNAQLNANLAAEVAAVINGIDDTDEAVASVSDLTAYTANGKVYTVADALQVRPLPVGLSVHNVPAHIAQSANAAYEETVLDYGRGLLYAQEPAYRNLVNEYRDGYLLFEISNRKVWDRAAKDTKGLEEFFQTNRDNYTWEKPHFKGYVISAINDSIAQAAVAYLDKFNFQKSNPELIAGEFKKEFGRNAKLESVVMAQGENAIIDYLAFGGAKPNSDNTRWKEYVAYRASVINAPEEASDIKGAVITDYQTVLEKEWVDQLYKTYPVKINNKVLKKAK